MKTLKAILKDLLKGVEAKTENKSTHSTTVMEADRNFSNSNETNNETETNEADGDNGMADTHAPQTDGNNQESQEPSNERAAALKAAYNEGLIAGRNEVIEEKFFPSDTDGIPNFHGHNCRISYNGDIFSLAREA